MARRAVCFKAVDLHLLRRVLVPARLRPQGLAVATVAACLATKELVSACGCRPVEVLARLRMKYRKRQLVKMQSGKFPGHQIALWIYRDKAQLGSRGNRELAGVIKARVKESPP